MADGKGCKCAAYSSHECGCDADWTPQEIYDLRDKIKQLEARLAERDQQIRRIYETLAWHPFDNFPGQFYKKYEVLKEQIAKHKACVEALSALISANEERESYFRRHLVTYPGPEIGKELWDEAKEALARLEGEKLQGGNGNED